MTHSLLHHTIVRHFVDHGNAPSVDDLCALLAQPRGEVVASLRALADYHGVVLHPNSAEIWAVHPFSAAPTNFWVQTEAGGWWGNCAWCSMGIVALVGGTATITTTLGAERAQVVIRINDGKLADDGFVVHFPIPMRHAWDNVTYTCSNMLLFESDAAIDDWCARHRMAKGDVQPLANVLAFAAVWYGRHLDPDWVKWTTAEATEIFDRFALTGPIWQIDATAARF